MSLSHRASVMLVSLSLFFALGSAPGSAQRTATDNHVAYYQRLLQRNPQNAQAYHGLGDALIRKARETGDPSYFNRAEEALKKSLQLNPASAGAMRHLSYVFYSRHEFEDAAIHARKAIDMNPADGDSYGVLGDALIETGAYAQAEEAYDKMMQREQTLSSYSRRAGLKAIRGDSAGAIADLESAIAAGKAAKQPPESIAWAEWQLGSDHFAIGNLAKAESFYRQSLKTYPNYYRALAGLGQVRAAQAQYDQAIDLFRQAVAILPMPEYIAALGDLYRETGKRDDARKQYELVEYIGKLNAINKALYNRELAYFYADHDTKPREGLELARRELEYRRDIYAYDVLAWNLYKNGQFEKAGEAIAEALKLNTKDAKLFFHAGMIYHRLGDNHKAREYLSRALKTNRHFHIIFADVAARTLKDLERSAATVAVQEPSDRR